MRNHDSLRQVCLFGAAELSLRDAMRVGCDDAHLVALVRAALYNKRPQHAGESVGSATRTLSYLSRDRISYGHASSSPGMTNLAKMKNRPMILIGG